MDSYRAWRPLLQLHRRCAGPVAREKPRRVQRELYGNAAGATRIHACVGHAYSIMRG